MKKQWLKVIIMIGVLSILILNSFALFAAPIVNSTPFFTGSFTEAQAMKLLFGAYNGKESPWKLQGNDLQQFPKSQQKGLRLGAVSKVFGKYGYKTSTKRNDTKKIVNINQMELYRFQNGKYLKDDKTQTGNTAADNGTGTSTGDETEESILDSKVYPNRLVKVDPERGTRTETVILADGSRFAVTRIQSDYYVLRYEFEVARINREPSDLNFWIEKMVELLTGVKEGQPEIIAFMQLPGQVGEYLKQNPEPNLGDEIIIIPEEIRHFLLLEKIEQTPNRTKLIFSYNVGPL